MERPDLQRVRAATVAAVVMVRAAVAATLAYAFSPALGLVALATLLDAGAGLDTGLRAVRGADRSRWLLWVELAARGVLLWLARREVFGGPSVATFSHRSWAGGSLLVSPFRSSTARRA